MFSVIRWQDIADIIIMSFLVYQLYGWFKNTKAFQVVVGLVSLGVLYLITRNLGFFMTSWILEELGTALFVLIIVIFQAEIRQALYRFSPLRSFFGRQDNGPQLDLVELTSTIFSLAKERAGALIVFQRKEPVDEYLLHGVVLDSVLSGQLIGSIFRDGTPLHDGAIVIRYGRVYQASAHLPLSVNSEIPSFYGTRHRAALGLSERSDAAVVVVSEERGEVSLALAGELKKIHTPEMLANILNGLLYSPAQETSPTSIWLRLRRNFWSKLLVVLLVFLVWAIVTTREGEIITTSVPVKYRNLPERLLLTGTSPDRIEVQVKTVSSLIPSPKEGEIAAEVDLSGIGEGSSNVRISKEDFTRPPGVMISEVKPSTLKVTAEKKAQKWVSVQPKVVGSPGSGKRLKKIKMEPSSVRIEGPQKALSRMTEIPTEEISLSEYNQSVSIEKKLIAPSSQVRVLWDGNIKIRLIFSK